jgi:hypothetical protein
MADCEAAELLMMHMTRAECTDWLGQLVGITVQLKNHTDLIEYSATLLKLLEDFDRRPKNNQRISDVSRG